MRPSLWNNYSSLWNYSQIFFLLLLMFLLSILLSISLRIIIHISKLFSDIFSIIIDVFTSQYYYPSSAETLTDLQDRSKGPIWTHFCYFEHILLRMRDGKFLIKFPREKMLRTDRWGSSDQVTWSDRRNFWPTDRSSDQVTWSDRREIWPTDRFRWDLSGF